MSHTYDSGAVRNDMQPRYRDVPHELIERIAKAFAHGAEKYEQDLPPYEKNWEKGDLTFALDAIDHLLKHVLKYKEMVHAQLNGRVFIDDEAEDHLGHAGANLAMLARFEAWGYWDLPRAGEATYELTPAGEAVVRKMQDAPFLSQYTDSMEVDGSMEDPFGDALMKALEEDPKPSPAERLGSLLRSLVGKG